MAKLSVAKTNLDYLEQIKTDRGLDSVTKALHQVIQDHQEFNNKNACTITSNSLT